MKTSLRIGILMHVALATAISGCGMSDSKESPAREQAETRSVEEAESETVKISSKVLDIIDVKGKVSEPGPMPESCPGEDREEFFKMRHPWSLTASSNKELKAAMERLKKELPRSGWNISGYGPNNSRNKSLELRANHFKKKFAVSVVLWEKHSVDDDPPRLVVTVVSDCFRKGE